MTITNAQQLSAAFRELGALIAEGSQGNAENEARFAVLASAIEQYEDKLQAMPLPPQYPGGHD